MNGILIAIIGLVAAFVGGALQAYATNRFEKSKFQREAKWQLYSSFFETLGELSFAGKDEQKHKSALARMSNIRGKIGIQGSPEVVQAVAIVFQYSFFTSLEAKSALAHAVYAMRKDVGTVSDGISDEHFMQLMFNIGEAPGDPFF